MQDVTERVINATQKLYYFSPKNQLLLIFSERYGAMWWKKTDMTDVTKEKPLRLSQLANSAS